MKCRDVIGWSDGLGLRKAVGVGLGLVIKVMWLVEWVFRQSHVTGSVVIETETVVIRMSNGIPSWTTQVLSNNT